MNDLLLTLLPSPTLKNAERCREIAQTIYASPALISGVAFYVSQKGAQKVANSPSGFKLILLPSSFIHSLAGNNEVLFRKTCWLAPLSGMLISTLTSYTFYALLGSSLVNGIILGCHSAAMLLFSQASWRDDVFGLITLEGSITSLFLSPDRFRHLNQMQLLSIEFKSNKAASITLLVSSVALTFLFKNPILANSIAYPLAVIVKIATMSLINALSIR